MKIIIFIVFLFLVSAIYSQHNDSIYLNQNIDSVVVVAVAISPSKVYFPSLSKETVYNLKTKNYSFNNLSDVLDNNAKVSLKKYGEGQISSISVKGFNASHTDVFWNGVKLNSPSLGQADLSIISLGNNTNLSISEGNNIAGKVSLDNYIDYLKKNKELTFTSSLSSFASFKQSISYEFSKNKNFYSNSNVSFIYNLNKYKYANKSLPNNEEIYLENGEIRTINFEQINALRLDYENSLNTFFKIFYADRNIAPTIYESSSSKNQKDNLYLAKIEWRNINKYKRYKLKLNFSFVKQNLRFKLSKNSTAILNSSNSLQANLLFNKVIINKFKFELLLNNELENGNSNNYSKNIWRNKLLIKPSFSFDLGKKLNIRTSVSEFLVKNEFSKPLASISLKYFERNLPAALLLQFDYSKKIKFPTLNDLYWNPGGNINLKEEYAHSFNLVSVLKRDFKPFKDNNKFVFENKLELFNVFSENYIQWQATNNGYWNPINLGNVFSRGFTNNFSLKYIFKDSVSNISNNFSYNFTRITKTKEIEQLIYVPMNSIYNTTSLNTKWFKFIVEQQYVSQKYTSYDNELFLNSYYLLDLAIYKNFKLKNNNNFSISIEVNNILNKTYFTYINRPLPKRNLYLNFTYVFGL